MKINSTRLAIAGLLLCCSLIAGPLSENTNAAQGGESFQIELRDGNVVTRQLAMSTLTWTDVSKVGQMSETEIELSRIKSIVFALEPASEQLARILRLIRQLDSDDFYLREAAEASLIEAGSRFRTVMQENDDLKTADGIYRLKRVLSSMRSDRKHTGFELDVLTFNDGRKLSGDAGKTVFKLVAADGQTREIPRSMIADISRPKPLTKTRDQSPSAIKTELFHSHPTFMKGRQLKLVDFEHKPNGEALSFDDKDITSTFVDWGLILACEQASGGGGVGISGYEFDSGDQLVGGNSICTYKPKRFYGAMELSFCQPGTEGLSHGVRDVGMFVSRVNHSRDVIVQAWDAAGRLIGVCESADEPCTFFGISSSVPIAKVRILSNPWLLELRKLNAVPGKKALQGVDKDFAIDSVMFSNPVPIDSPRHDPHYFGRNGDLLKANSLTVRSGGKLLVRSSSLPQVAYDLSDASTVTLKAIAPPHQLKPFEGRWSAMLKDNSVLQWTTGKPFFSETLGKQIDLAEIVAVWPANQAPRLPLAGDFEKGKSVLVYPGCRVVTDNVELNQMGYAWESQKVLTEDLYEKNDVKVDQRSNDKPDAVAPRLQKYGWDISELPVFETPTVWLAEPTSMLAGQGAIKLEGGEVIVFGKDTNFELQSVDQSKVTLTAAGQVLALPISKVTSIVATQE